jgi:hypothetical protein
VQRDEIALLCFHCRVTQKSAWKKKFELEVRYVQQCFLLGLAIRWNPPHPAGINLWGEEKVQKDFSLAALAKRVNLFVGFYYY